MSLRNLKEIYPNIIYICIGQGDTLESQEKLIKELKLERNVLFLKNLSKDEKKLIFKKFKCFCYAINIL